MWARFLDFLFPLECLACGAAGAHCCPSCLAGVPLSPRSFEISGLRAYAAYAYAQPIVRRLIHDLKYEGWTVAAEPLGALVRRWARTHSGVFGKETLLVPVPLSARKAHARGFNQASHIAEALGAVLKLSVEERLITRVRETKPQTGVLDRGRNMAGAFLARVPRRLRSRTFVLVDDVWTTGSTMAECARALRAAGASDVRGFALAWGNFRQGIDRKSGPV